MGIGTCIGQQGRCLAPHREKGVVNESNWEVGRVQL